MWSGKLYKRTRLHIYIFTNMRPLIREVLMNTPPDTTVIYVKGSQKKDWLLSLLGDCDMTIGIETIDVDYEDISRLETLIGGSSFLCGRHLKNCALCNIMHLHTWWSQRHDQLADYF
ncbi:PREDICTED: uncharacterized protein LOC106746451 [Dinoponera quadriceps]|uniref:Uncharacterized protein LOC106746451 n=1 Tax=Dinoponera quadriceps TaxID=609295 RepID=A0A6P3XKP7_DINQU|nr:PREDICTED: uncharacterized protein LOC106746451 [Dinoponera quadriceps]